jgi:hypothetical protein
MLSHWLKSSDSRAYCLRLRMQGLDLVGCLPREGAQKCFLMATGRGFQQRGPRVVALECDYHRDLQFENEKTWVIVIQSPSADCWRHLNRWQRLEC